MCASARTHHRVSRHHSYAVILIPFISYSSARVFASRDNVRARCHVRTASPLAFSVRFFFIFLLFSFPSALSYVRDTRSCNISDIARVRAEIIFASKDRTRLRRACNPSAHARAREQRLGVNKTHDGFLRIACELRSFVFSFLFLLFFFSFWQATFLQRARGCPNISPG